MKEVQIIKASKDKVIRSGAIIKNKIRVAPLKMEQLKLILH